MPTYASGPVHQKSSYRRPTFTRTSLAPPRRWRAGVLRSSCGHLLGLYALYGARQAAWQWKECRA